MRLRFYVVRCIHEMVSIKRSYKALPQSFYRCFHLANPFKISPASMLQKHPYIFTSTCLVKFTQNINKGISTNGHGIILKKVCRNLCSSPACRFLLISQSSPACILSASSPKLSLLCCRGKLFN